MGISRPLRNLLIAVSAGIGAYLTQAVTWVAVPAVNAHPRGHTEGMEMSTWQPGCWRCPVAIAVALAVLGTLHYLSRRRPSAGASIVRLASVLAPLQILAFVAWRILEVPSGGALDALLDPRTLIGVGLAALLSLVLAAIGVVVVETVRRITRRDSLRESGSHARRRRQATASIRLQLRFNGTGGLRAPPSVMPARI